MFGLFTPKCPLDTAEKVWVERRMLWFAERFGIDRMRNARVITPTEEFFPDRYDADTASVRRCLDRVCVYMSVDPSAITLEVLPDEYMPNAAGWYEMRARSNICIAESQLADPTRLIATLAHEVAHEILLRDGHLTGEEPDHEQTTDLLPAFLGIGIFGANATLRASSGWEANMSWWSISSQGYLTSFVLGYALALFAFVRDEEPTWGAHLLPDPRGAFKKGLRFCQKTGDALFTPDTAGAQQPAPTTARALDWLNGRSPSFRIAALWDIATTPLTDPRFAGPIIQCLAHADSGLRQEAAWAVASFGEAAADAVAELIRLLSDDNPGTRAAAARSIGIIRPRADWVVWELAHALNDRLGYVAWEAAESLRAYGLEAGVVLPKLLAAFEKAVGCNDDATIVFARAFHAVSPNAQKAWREHVNDRDPDLLRLGLHELKETARDTGTTERHAQPPLRLGIPFPRDPR